SAATIPGCSARNQRRTFSWSPPRIWGRRQTLASSSRIRQPGWRRHTPPACSSSRCRIRTWTAAATPWPIGSSRASPTWISTSYTSRPPAAEARPCFHLILFTGRNGRKIFWRPTGEPDAILASGSRHGVVAPLEVETPVGDRRRRSPLPPFRSSCEVNQPLLAHRRLACAAELGARRHLPDVQPREERRQTFPLGGRHELEVAPAVDDLPEVLAAHVLERVADREQPLRRFVLHVTRDAAGLFGLAGGQIVRCQLHLGLAHAEQRAFLAARAQGTIELQEAIEHG